MSKTPKAKDPISRYNLPLTFGMGILVLLSLTKFGVPVQLSSMVVAPTTFDEWIYYTWPLAWGGLLVIGIAVLSGLIGMLFNAPSREAVQVSCWRSRILKLLFCTPLAWIIWQCIASIQSRRLESSEGVVIHFALCGLCFLMASKLRVVQFFEEGQLVPEGMASSSRSQSHSRSDAQSQSQSQSGSWLIFAFWIPVILGAIWMMRSGIEQKFGGLEATRQMLYEDPELLAQTPPEYLERISKNRIFGTYFYPNAFAGAMILALPAIAGFLMQARRHVRPEGGMRSALLLTAMALLAVGAACLVWSGSKAGWLIAMVQCAALLALAPVPPKIKWGVMVAGLALGCAAFFIKYADFFSKGATSVGARFGYWSAAFDEWQEHPFWGSGPGTFDLYYAERKEPDWEMTRLAHNDYLQQASDSGILGMVTYVGWIAWILIQAFRRLELWRQPLVFGLWLGALGWALQSFVEFGLYVPGISWIAFTWMGLIYGLCVRTEEPTAVISS